MEQVFKPSTVGGFIRAVSGLFITKENINGLSPKELLTLTTLLELVGSKEITREDKIKLSDLLNQSLQVTTNYLAKFRKKKVIINNRLNSILLKDKIVIEYGRA